MTQTLSQNSSRVNPVILLMVAALCLPLVSCNGAFISRDTVHTDCLANKKILSGVELKPLAYKNRTFFKIEKIIGGSLWQESGYEKDDVIYSINGKLTDGPNYIEDNIEAFCWRGSKIEILRNNLKILCRPVEGCVDPLKLSNGAKKKPSKKPFEDALKFNRPRGTEVEIKTR